MMGAFEIIAEVIVMIVSALVLWITVTSHIKLRSRKNDTLGRKVYRWALILFSVCGIIWGFKFFTGAFLIAAVLAERLIVLRGCKGQRKLGRFLQKINW